MAIPSKQYLDGLDALNGAPKVSHPFGGTTFPRIERTFTLPIGAQATIETTLTDYPGATLVQADEISRDQLRIKWYVRYDTLPGKPLTTSRIDPEMNVVITTTQTPVASGSVTPGAVVSGGGAILTITEVEPANGYDTKIVTVIPRPPAHDISTALIETQALAFQFPGRIDIPTLDNYGTSIGYQSPNARLVQATVRTYWVISDTSPTLAFDVIAGQTISINDVEYKDVLHDATTRAYNNQFVFIPATTPSNATYVAAWIGQPKVVDGEVKATRYQKLWMVKSSTVIMR